MKELLIVAGLLMGLFVGSFAQDKAYLAKVEYEMAEEALAAKNYREVAIHLDKAIGFLGQSNAKIDYLRLLSNYEHLQDPNVIEGIKGVYYIGFYERSRAFLKTYANASNKEKYGEVYRWQSETEPKVKALRQQYTTWYSDFRSYNRTVDSLKLLNRTNWLEEKRGIDGIWNLGRTYDAIISHYKSAVIKKLNAAKAPVTASQNKFKAYLYADTYFTLTEGFTISNLNAVLPEGSVTFSGESVVPVSAWFNADNRLFAIKYLRLGKEGRLDFEQPLENAWTCTGANWKRYVTGSSYILEFFSNATESGLWLILPYATMAGGDPDGNGWTSISTELTEPSELYNRSFFKKVYGYEQSINIDGENASGAQRGCLLTQVSEDGSAAAAGLRQNDIITRFGHRKIISFANLRKAIFLYRQGEVVEVEYVRDGVVRKTQLVVGKT